MSEWIAARTGSAMATLSRIYTPFWGCVEGDTQWIGPETDWHSFAYTYTSERKMLQRVSLSGNVTDVSRKRSDFLKLSDADIRLIVS